MIKHSLKGTLIGEMAQKRPTDKQTQAISTVTPTQNYKPVMQHNRETHD